MRFPNESLDEYKARIAKVPDPPAPVTLELTGETEVLTPLAYWEGPVKSESLLSTIFRHLSWFHRSLAMAGALTVVTFLLGTGLYLLIYGPPVDPDAGSADQALVQQPDESFDTADELSLPNQFVDEDSPTALDGPDTVPSIRSRTPARARIFRASYRSRTSARVLLSQWLHPQPWVSQFTPTTQFIYIENGVVRTRIEPQSSYRKTLSN